MFSLALGGGAARGLAHIGVIRKLEELSMQPIAISGTSMGAIVATLYALSYSSIEMEQIAKEMKLIKLIDIDMKHGLLKGKKIVQFLEAYIGKKEFEDTTIPLSIISTDINTGEKIIFQSGKLLDAVRSSIGLPGIFIPHSHLGRQLVDGGLSENLPLSVLPKEYPIIAVSVQIDILHKKKKETDIISRLWKNSLFMNSYTILRNAVTIMIGHNEKQSLACHPNIFLIQPKQYDIDYYDFTKSKELIQAGYEACSEVERFLKK